MDVEFSLLTESAGLLGTINKYSKKEAIVQSGWKTQLVSPDGSVVSISLMRVQVLGILASCIVGTCVIFLSISTIRSGSGS